jgi:hypothetical protein
MIKTLGQLSSKVSENSFSLDVESHQRYLQLLSMNDQPDLPIVECSHRLRCREKIRLVSSGYQVHVSSSYISSSTLTSSSHSLVDRYSYTVSLFHIRRLLTLRRLYSGKHNSHTHLAILVECCNCRASNLKSQPARRLLYTHSQPPILQRFWRPSLHIQDFPDNLDKCMFQSRCRFQSSARDHESYPPVQRSHRGISQGRVAIVSSSGLDPLLTSSRQYSHIDIFKVSMSSPRCHLSYPAS